MDRVCIQVSKETHSRLMRLGRKGDTFEDIVKGLLNSFVNDKTNKQ